MTSLAVSLAAGKLLPEVAGGTAWPYEVVGAGYAVLGLVMIAYGHRRQTQIEEALATDGFAPLESGVAVALVVLGVALALGTLVLLFL